MRWPILWGTIAILGVGAVAACTRVGFAPPDGAPAPADARVDADGASPEADGQTAEGQVDPLPDSAHDGPHDASPLSDHGLADAGTPDISGAPPTATWAKPLAQASGDWQANAMAVDGGGRLFFTGSFEGSVNFGGNTLQVVQSKEVFVVSLDSGGARRWDLAFGGTLYNDGFAVAVDSVGNVYATGDFQGSITLGGTALAASHYDAFLASFTNNGVVRWARGFGSAGLDAGQAVVVANSSVYLAGRVGGPVTIDAVTFSHNAGDDAFLASFDAATGSCGWGKGMGGTTGDYGRATAVDAAGNVYVSVETNSPTLTIGNDALSGSGDYDVVLARFSSTGNPVWARRFGGTSYEVAPSMASNGSTSLLLTGHFYSPSFALAGSSMVNAGGADGFLSALDNTGNGRWEKAFGAAGGQRGDSVAVDRNGNVYVFGTFDGTFDAGGGALVSAGQTDLFLASFSPGGAHRWSVRLGGNAAESATAIAVDSSGSLYLLGRFSGTLDLGTGPMTAAGPNDVFVAKLTP